MNFGRVDNIILLGGSPLLAEFAIFLKSSKYPVTVFSSQRQLNEIIKKDGKSLKGVLIDNNIDFHISIDICKDRHFYSLITETTLALGVGEVWRFDKKTIEKFNGRLLDFMGIPLPRYRGGAHYSWLILRRGKNWGCNLQIINEEMIQEVFDSGEIVKSKEYLFPPTVRIPQDYFDFAVKSELSFLKEFLQEIEDGHEFELAKVQENFSIYFPRLYTLKHGFINWNWKTEDIVTFISAFDSPYKGASTFIDEKRVFLKDCYAEFNDGPFHPFQSGLIYKKSEDAIFVAAIDGTIVIKNISGEQGEDLMGSVKVGQRLYTPASKLEESMRYSAIYDAKGITDK